MGEPLSFGQWLRHRRRELDLTQEELGLRLGCARITIRKIEADQMRPSKQLAELLRERLGVPAEERESFVHFARGGEVTQPIAVTAPKHNLPHPVSSFIGRGQAIAEIKLIVEGFRLVTLTGAGGSGKTRLAIEVARQMLNQFPDGIWFIGFAPLVEPALVQQSIASVLKVREDPTRPLIQTLISHLYSKNLLLLFDNCEHLIAECAQTAETLLQACPQLRILATSREALDVAGEEQYHVRTLSLPQGKAAASLGKLHQSEAVQLFVERAGAVKLDFTLTRHNAEAVVQICQHLDGIPLALELAAARVKLLTVGHLAERLDDRFNLLTGGSRTALPRQQTLRATIEWSYDLLDEDTRGLFRQLSVFAGSFTQRAVAAVCSDEQHGPDQALAELSQLVDRSLVEVMQQGEAERYRMLETIRMYARERLRETGEEARVRDRHLQFFAEWAEEVEPKLRSAEQINWWDQMEMEQNNICAALEWALSEGDGQMGLRLAGAAVWFWNGHNYRREGLKWLKDALSKVPTHERTPAHAKVMVNAGFLAFEFYTADPIDEWFREGLSILREVGDKWWISFTLLWMGWQHIYVNEAISAVDLLKESVAIARETHDEWILGCALRGLGAALERVDYEMARPILEEGLLHTRVAGERATLGEALRQLATVALGLGDYVQLESLAEESVRLFRELGDREDEAESTLLLAVGILGQGKVPRGQKILNESLMLAQSVGHRVVIAEDIIYLGCVAELEDQPRRAAVLLAVGESILESLGTSIAMHPWCLSDYEGCTEKAKAQLGEAGFNEAIAEGRAMTVEEAVRYALGGTGDD